MREAEPPHTSKSNTTPTHPLKYFMRTHYLSSFCESDIGLACWFFARPRSDACHGQRTSAKEINTANTRNSEKKPWNARWNASAPELTTIPGANPSRKNHLTATPAANDRAENDPTPTAIIFRKVALDSIINCLRAVVSRTDSTLILAWLVAACTKERSRTH